ncbi:putative UDP-glucosyltransferase YdhE [Pseudolycoriella hygida]|uniref:UDP-glucosyltransferase YdhE n=1 Tax=Pseudolycoriella hygida TaxID=35572 RepID=A0A9Q0MW09_9DIPT|nr:putative UDP-glucosyltransferase YdhE [Pseudolycoriella hygida]
MDAQYRMIEQNIESLLDDQDTLTLAGLEEPPVKSPNFIPYKTLETVAMEGPILGQYTKWSTVESDELFHQQHSADLPVFAQAMPPAYMKNFTWEAMQKFLLNCLSAQMQQTMTITKQICSFCKKNGMTFATYSSHSLRVNGVLQCPFLLNCQCTYCLRNGHTTRYCPLKERTSSIASSPFFDIRDFAKDENYHLALHTFSLDTFYGEFNAACRNLKSVSEARKFKFRHYFNLLLRAVRNIKGDPSSISNTTKGLQSEIKANISLKTDWNEAVKWFAIEKKKHSDFAKDENYHLALHTFSLNTFYGEFNAACRNLKSVKEAQQFKFRHYFNLLLRAVRNVKGEPSSISNTTKVYRGCNVKFPNLVVGQNAGRVTLLSYHCIRQFFSIAVERAILKSPLINCFCRCVGQVALKNLCSLLYSVVQLFNKLQSGFDPLSFGLEITNIFDKLGTFLIVEFLSRTQYQKMSNSKLKVLFAPAQGMGHIGACHGLADILRQQGHECVIILDIKFKGRLAKHGHQEAILQEIGPESHSITEPELLQSFFKSHTDDIIAMPPIDVIKSIGPIIGQMFEDSQKLEVNFKAVVDSVSPDVIICDTHIASPALMNSGIPWILLCSMAPMEFYNSCNPDDKLPPAWSGLSINGNKDDWQEFRKQHASLGGNLHEEVDKWYYNLSDKHLPATGLQPLSPFLNIYITPEELDFKDAQSLGEKWVGVNGFVRQTNETITLPDWLIAKPGKLILLSLGSLASGHLELMKFVTESLSKSAHKFIVCTGINHDKYTLPDNMWGQPFLPQAALYPMVDCVIAHGGNNSLYESFYYGKPLLLIPIFFDQFDNAQRLVDTNLGYRLPRGSSADEFVKIVDQLANDNELSVRMKEISERIKNCNDRQTITERIEQIARQNKQ